jgi:hypothetical protein
MKPSKHITSVLGVLALTLALPATVPTAHANVYPTNIKINGTLQGAASVGQGSGASISYLLNEPASLGVTIQILSGATVVRTLSIAGGSAGTTRGLNTVAWDGKNNSNAALAPGNYTVKISASSSGYLDWTAISNDNDPGMAAHYPWGMDVDKNTNSAYYGRVIVGSAAGSGPDPARTGLYKMNADGSVADEGWFGDAGYHTDDGGSTATDQMPNAQAHESWTWNPATIRIAEDDRIYWCDGSAVGAIIAADILATTNQVVITSGTYVSAPDFSHWGGPHNYQDCPEVSMLDTSGYGLRQFDICNAGTTNAAIYLVDYGDYPDWGVWMWHLVGGQSDTNDTVGTQVVASSSTDFPWTCAAGVSVDYNLDVFVSSGRHNATDTSTRVGLYTNWNSGVLPQPTNAEYAGSMGYVLGNGPATPAWLVANPDAQPYVTSIYDTVIDSRVHPTKVAVCMANGDTAAGGYNGHNGGIRVLNAADGSVVVTNLDIANWYNGVAFDNVGNVYGCSRSSNKWRVWSPPGANNATTPAVATLQVIAPPVITSITVAAGTATIHFTGAASDPASAFTLLSSGAVTPLSGYGPAAGASITGSAGTYQATVTTSGTAQFYRIKR